MSMENLHLTFNYGTFGAFESLFDSQFFTFLIQA